MTFPLPETLPDVTDHLACHVDIHKLLNNNVRTVSGTADTLVLADFGKTVETTSASATAVTVPPNSSVAYPIGTVVAVCQVGAGTVTLVAGAGVTINTPASLVSAGQWSQMLLRKRATDTWVVGGGLL